MGDRNQVIYDLERCVCKVPDACIDCSKHRTVVPLECMEELMKDALELLKEQPNEIGYHEKSDALLKMWMDDDITDGEYGKIMNRLNKKVKQDG